MISFPTYTLNIPTHYLAPKRNAPRRLRRLLLRLRNFLNTFDDNVEAPYTVVTLDTRKLMDMINDHAYDIRRRTGADPKYIIMGRDKYYQLTGEIAQRSPRIIDLTTPTTSVMGMSLIVVPWIDGLFCLPDLDSLRA